MSNPSSGAPNAGQQNPAVPVTIFNEAGTAVVATGVTSNAAAPYHVTQLHLATANPIVVQREYQISVNGGNRTGVMCTAVGAAAATFS
jgi:hypothetical protein